MRDQIRHNPAYLVAEANQKQWFLYAAGFNSRIFKAANKKGGYAG